MRIKTYGNFDNPKILLIPPMMSDEKIFIKLIPKLCKKYYVVLPVLSGHYPNSTYKSMQKEELEISIFLKSHNINKIDILMGFDIGGNIAYDYFYKNTDIIDKVIIDSAPLYKKGFIVRQYYYNKYNKMILKIIRDKKNIVNIINQYFKDKGEYIKNVVPLVNDLSLENLMKTRFGVKIHTLNKKNQEKITFVYGNEDKNRSSLRRIKQYKYSNIMIIKNADNCQYAINKPTSYIKKIIEKEG